MSICRRTWAEGVYIMELGSDEPDHFMCQICPMTENGGDWQGHGRLSLTWHVLAHKHHNPKFPLKDVLQNIWWYRS